jgi:4-oxalocrotonate tautomerase
MTAPKKLDLAGPAFFEPPNRSPQMPLVRIAVHNSRSAAQVKAISESVYTSMLETINVPKDDNFQIITKHDSTELIFDPGYLGVPRSEGFISIQIFLNQGRTVEMKKALYKAIAEKIHASAGVRQEDIFIGLVEVVKENWSFGNGIAQYAQ